MVYNIFSFGITWIFEEDSYSPIAKIKKDKQYSIINDHLGTPIEAYADDGKSIWERELNSNGKVLKEKGTIGTCPFLFQGQYYDEEVELAYNRFRYYDPEEGRYISQDPIGLASGEFGFYNYVHDTNGWIDVFGLQKTYGDGFEMTSKKKTNKREGGRREDTFKRILQDIYGENNVLSERMLLDSNGNKVTSGGT